MPEMQESVLEQEKERNRSYSRKSMKKFRENNPERIKEIRESFHDRHPGWKKENNALYRKRNRYHIAIVNENWRKRNPEKKRAHRAVFRYIKNGSLTKPDKCESCGKGGYIVAHHDDYTRWLDVRWVCVSCHLAIHGIFQPATKQEQKELPIQSQADIKKFHEGDKQEGK